MQINQSFSVFVHNLFNSKGSDDIFFSDIAIDVL